MSVRITSRCLLRLVQLTNGQCTLSRQNFLHEVRSYKSYHQSSFCVKRHFTKHSRIFNEEKPGTERPERAQTTIDQDEVDKFSALAQLWWDEGGEFEALHTMNELRVPLITDSLIEQRRKRGDDGEYKAHCPLKGFNILDIGSGGGILSEPLARLGASVVGVDASKENIKTAHAHVMHDKTLAKNIKYICGTVEDLAETEKRSFDAVVASEVIEHVADRIVFVKACCRLVKPGGSIFLTTINQTRLAYILGIVAAEQFLRIVPPGTHDWNKFVSPQDIQYLLNQNGFSTRLVHGMMYNPLNKRWTWIENTSINYAMHAVCTDEALKVDNQ